MPLNRSWLPFQKTKIDTNIASWLAISFFFFFFFFLVFSLRYKYINIKYRKIIAAKLLIESRFRASGRLATRSAAATLMYPHNTARKRPHGPWILIRYHSIGPRCNGPILMLKDRRRGKRLEKPCVMLCQRATSPSTRDIVAGAAVVSASLRRRRLRVGAAAWFTFVYIFICLLPCMLVHAADKG